MFCEMCGAQMREGDKFCPLCGEKVKELVVKKSKKEKVWNVFANLGFGLGLGSFIASFFAIFTNGSISNLAVAGIVFSALGRKSLKYRDKAKLGLGFSIAGLAITIAMLCFYVFIKILAAIYN